MGIFAAVAPLRAALVCTFAVLGASGDADAIDPEALVGCRAPDEPGCSRCCVATGEVDRCTYLVGEEDWSLYDVDPWYNGAAVEDRPCPPDCPRCARCSERAERELRALAPRPECDCASMTYGVDPCFNPGSCACHCRRRESLLSQCPPA